MCRIRGPLGVFVGVLKAGVEVTAVGVFGGAVAVSGMGSSEEIFAQPVSKPRKITNVRILRIILNRLGR